ncbi:MAG: inositol monophosphatase [Anaerolineaceae bacterium]|nr:inositol monophosphatase [Anaerolineaceae bacterium]
MEPKRSDLVRMARQTGEILRAGFGKQHQVEYKGIINPVTEMDRQAETFLLEQIKHSFPTHTIITEESGHLPGDDDHCWYIDPLDGTSNYAHNLPIFSVSIAYALDGRVVQGAIYDPMQDECFSAGRGEGAWLNGKPIHVSNTNDLNKSLLATGFPYDIQTNPQDNLDNFSYFTRHTEAVRRLGSAALDLAYVAAGRLDGYWEKGIYAWDIAAGALIVEEAGGLVSDLEGNPDYFQPPYPIVAAAPGIHPQLIAGLNRYK